jgi:hypothetical protein
MTFPKEPSLTINMKTLGWVAGMIGILYSLNRPVTAFNNLSAAVDRLAAAVSRIDAIQDAQDKMIQQMRLDIATLQAVAATNHPHGTDE